jgi:hypothetical protein
VLLVGVVAASGAAAAREAAFAAARAPPAASAAFTSASNAIAPLPIVSIAHTASNVDNARRAVRRRAPPLPRPSSRSIANIAEYVFEARLRA